MKRKRDQTAVKSVPVWDSKQLSADIRMTIQIMQINELVDFNTVSNQVEQQFHFNFNQQHWRRWQVRKHIAVQVTSDSSWTFR